MTGIAATGGVGGSVEYDVVNRPPIGQFDPNSVSLDDLIGPFARIALVGICLPRHRVMWQVAQA